jgi:hypothetical protein
VAFFPIHIIIKDLSFMILYFVIMKYSLTGETYSPSILASFPAAANMTALDMISVSLYANMIPLFVSFLSYYPIVYGIKWITKSRYTIRLILTGVALTSTTPLVIWIFNDFKHNNFFYLNAEIVSWILCYLLSISIYYLLNVNQTEKAM